MRKVIVTRDSMSDNNTLGVCTVIGDDEAVLFTSQSLELPWKDNQRNISCVPEGTYELKLEFSNRFQTDLWELYGVPDRSECKFHAANYVSDLNGCIALGLNRADINNDGIIDVTSSRNTMAKFHEAMDGYTESTVQIINPI